MTNHNKYDEILALVNANIAVLLTGEKGSGKTTLAQQIAEQMNLRFFSISMTRQTTLSHLLGFISVNGTYIPSMLTDAFTNGGLYLLDEIDAGDPNALLCLNTIENGYISFPTGIVKVHENFRLMATANPQDQHEFYTGRSKLDAATLDRFDIVDVGRDDNLEKSLVDYDTLQHMTLIRNILIETNSSIVISMRDSMRYQQRKKLGLLDGFLYRLVNKSDLVFDKYLEKLKSMPKHSDQSECETFEELVALVELQTGNPDNIPQSAESYDKEETPQYNEPEPK